MSPALGFLTRLISLAASLFIVNVDNVGSNQMHQIRVALRGKGIVVMGKNTMVRRALRSILSEYPTFERLLPHVKGNIGFVFTSSDLKEVRDIITANKVAAPARAGALAPKDVTIPSGNTGMEPGKTSFFQALGIPTKIARGTIEIVNDVQVVTAGTRVGPSEATLLNMLNISPFTYGMTVVQIFDQGNIFPPDVLDISDKELLDRFASGITTIAALSLALHYPTLVSVMHSLVNSYKNLIAVALATEYSFEGAEKVCSVHPLCCAHDCFITLKMLSVRWTECCFLFRLLSEALCMLGGLRMLTSIFVGQGVPRQPRSVCRRRSRRRRGRSRRCRGCPCGQGGGGGGV